jgi:capsular exopolysaccharide synthesis family protein
VIPGTRLLGVIPDTIEDPTLPESAELIVRHHPDSVLAESYRQAWNGVSRSLTRQGHTSLMLVSGMPESGTTTVLSNLAVTAAASGLRVIAIDANFRRPGLTKPFGFEEADMPGLGDLIGGTHSIDDVIQKSDDVDIIAAGTPASRVYERFNDPALASILAELRNRYDCVLLDTAPAIAAGDVMVLANRVESVAMVVQAGHEERGLIARMLGQFRDTPAELLGVILNRPRQTAGGYFKKNYRLMAKYTAIQE